MVRDQLLVFAAVTNCLSCSVDAAGQRGILHDPTTPNRGEEVVLADDTVAVLQQVHQQIEYLRLNRNEIETAAELASVRIKRMIGK